MGSITITRPANIGPIALVLSLHADARQPEWQRFQRIRIDKHEREEIFVPESEEVEVATVTSPGFASGIITFRKTLNSVLTSISAASRSSSGRVRKNEVSTNTVNAELAAI